MTEQDDEISMSELEQARYQQAFDLVQSLRRKVRKAGFGMIAIVGRRLVERPREYLHSGSIVDYPPGTDTPEDCTMMAWDMLHALFETLPPDLLSRAIAAHYRHYGYLLAKVPIAMPEKQP